jgi:transcriptional regulator with XRE-family HTH domain
MPTPLHLKPPTAAWIVRERRRLGLKTRDVAERLNAMGLDVTEATVKVWESNGDRRPSPYNLEGLERIFGSSAPTSAASTSSLEATMVSLLEELRVDREARRAQIDALIRTLVEDRLARSAFEQGFVEALTELASIATRRDDPAGATHEVAPERAGR